LNALGTHLLLDLKGCNPELLDDLHYIRQALMCAADEAGATIVGENFHKFEPVGVTGIVAIAESHLCIHTWPEYAYAAVDIFTCGANFKPRRAADLIIQRLQCKEPLITEMQRGLMPELVPSTAGRNRALKG
jgi:S-adenosylmethionine decarboxylase proenzyme